MLFDAIVLSGGRSSRLHAAPKSELLFGDRTLMRLTLDAAMDAAHVVLVGPAAREPLPNHVLLTREYPPFGGPVAGIRAGLAALAGREQRPRTPDAGVLVLACDMPGIAAAVPALLDAAEGDRGDGVIAVDAGREQPLAAIYKLEPLADALARHEKDGTLIGLGVFRLITGLKLERVTVPPGSTDDVDTWSDAARLGVRGPTPNTQQERREHDAQDENHQRRGGYHDRS